MTREAILGERIPSQATQDTCTPARHTCGDQDGRVGFIDFGIVGDGSLWWSGGERLQIDDGESRLNYNGQYWLLVAIIVVNITD